MFEHDNASSCECDTDLSLGLLSDVRGADLGIVHQHEAAVGRAAGAHPEKHVQKN